MADLTWEQPAAEHSIPTERVNAALDGLRTALAQDAKRRAA